MPSRASYPRLRSDTEPSWGENELVVIVDSAIRAALGRIVGQRDYRLSFAQYGSDVLLVEAA
jgi:hypothetical protein